MKELLRVAIRRALFISVWIRTGRRNRRAAGWPRVEDYGMKNFAALLALTLMLLVVACQKVEAPVRYLDNNIHDPVAAAGVGIRAGRAGTVETVRASYEFQKTEKGWQGQDGQSYEFGQRENSV